jgi:hypothetical protein
MGGSEQPTWQRSPRWDPGTIKLQGAAGPRPKGGAGGGTKGASVCGELRFRLATPRGPRSSDLVRELAHLRGVAKSRRENKVEAGPMADTTSEAFWARDPGPGTLAD